LDRMGYYDLPIENHPKKETVRDKANHYVTGRDGGREIDLRRFALEGMQLHGRLRSVDGNRLEFCDDLKQNLDGADGVAASIKKTIDGFIEKNQIEAPLDPVYRPLWEPLETALTLDCADIEAVIWCTGYRSDFSWLDVPVFNGQGYPGHERGVTGIWGLYFLGLPWLYTWGSGRFSGIARDANYLADYVATRKKMSPDNSWSVVNEFLLGS
jgi:putative flavoprotein involved in K+ transport